MLKRVGKIVLGSFLVLVVGIFVWGYQPDKPIAQLRAQYATPPSQFMELDGLQVHYRDEGLLTDSIPLVLLHGTSSSLFTWDSWVRELAPHERLIRLDLPNYALTGSDGHTVHMGPDYAHFVARFLDKVGVRRCHMAGNSLGGEITWQFARLYPDRLGKMVLIDAAGIPTAYKKGPIGFRLAHVPGLRSVLKVITPRSIFAASVRNVYGDPAKVTPELIQQYMDMTLREGNRDALIRRFMLDPVPYDNHRSDLPNIQTPALIIWGEKDDLIPVEAAYAFQQALPNDTLVIYPQAGHVPMEELGVETAALVKGWLRK